MSSQSIHNSGESALDCLIAELGKSGKATRGVRSGKNAKHVPDVTYEPSGKSLVIGVEVKKTGKSVPQMRPLSFKTHVIWRAPDLDAAAKWWVIPPHDLLQLALNHPGQHCISSFECMNPGTPSTAWEKWQCEPKELATKIESAFSSGQTSPYKKVAEDLVKEIEAMYQKHKETIRGLSASEA